MNKITATPNERYTVPMGVLPVPPGGMQPNSSQPCWSGGAGKIVALHRFDDGVLWILFQNHDGYWVTMRQARPEDEDHFVAAGAAIRA